MHFGGLGGKGRRKNERTDRVQVEVDIEPHKQKLEGQTSICSGVIHCSLGGLVLSTNAGYHDVQIRTLNLSISNHSYIWSILELLSWATPCNTIISL